MPLKRILYYFFLTEKSKKLQNGLYRTIEAKIKNLNTKKG